MITKIDSVMLECDNCKEPYESGSGYSIFIDESSLKTYADDDDWYTETKDGKPTGKHFCDKCYHFDDNDEFILNVKRTKI